MILKSGLGLGFRLDLATTKTTGYTCLCGCDRSDLTHSFEAEPPETYKYE
jgi:hypothetical protein